jgi:nanoRNase/pAp phosphatase (c-di-AMP/oligoRNAs hydrolase)
MDQTKSNGFNGSHLSPRSSDRRVEPPGSAALTKRRRTKRSDDLLAVVEPFDRVVVMMHDNPDPDAIATGWAVKLLIETKRNIHARLIAGGEIMRAENRHMVRLLDPPLELVDDYTPAPDVGVILVDCGPDATNHQAADDECRLIAVIDHHQPETPVDTPFRDIRPRVAASATLAASYLREQRMSPSTRLATAPLYALRTETVSYETHFSSLDRSILPWLTKLADPALVAEIESAPLSRDYFTDLTLAMQNTFIYDDVAFCLLPQAHGPEIIGEVADLLVRCEGIGRVLCGAAFQGSVLISVRTGKQSEDATKLLRETIAGMGRGGGHAHRAGGKLTVGAARDQIPEEVQDELRARWLRTCGVSRQRGTRLVARRDIVDNL